MPVYNASESGGQIMDPKDPGDVLDYVVDFAALANGNGNKNWLDTANSEVIASSVITMPSGLTLDSDDLVNTNTGVRLWISGGTAGTSYTIEIEITTDSTPARKKTIRMIIEVADR